LLIGIRIAGAVLILLCGWCCGEAAVQKLSARHKALEDTLRLLERIGQEIEYRKAPLPAVLGALRREGAYPSLALDECADLQTLAAPACLARGEQTLFEECFSGMGHSACAAECQRLQYYMVRFRQAAADAQEKENQARRVYPRLGLGAAAMVAIAAL
jgi:hypothetical protein